MRVGNAAAGQLQLDIYGALMDAVYLADKHGAPVSHETWARLSRSVDWVCRNWRQPDSGIWEGRGARREYLSARLMCWVALDQALRIARHRSLPAPEAARWLENRDIIYREIHERFWDARRGAFVGELPGGGLHASALLMPLVQFVGPVDPRWLSTLAAIERELVSDALVRRYATRDGGENVDGLDGAEGAFTPCSFWYVECLARAGRVREGRLLFEKLLGYASPVGLFSEEIGMGGEALGNVPQALTHPALISAAYALDRALDQA